MLDFFKHKDCGKVLLELSGGEACKDASLERLKPGSSDAAQEKHVPVASMEGNLLVVRIGSEPHPMTPEHYIEWVFVQTSFGGTFCNLSPGDEPEVKLSVEPSEVESVYIYCNLHGLWKAPEPVLSSGMDMNTVACSPEFSAGCVDPSEE